MEWYYKPQGIHVYVRVYMNGALCGSLVFRIEEFNKLKLDYPQTSYIED